VALKILLADDSMTAQNMGKKILVDAGYEVIPVSNGAAAVKKIAEHRPDLVILDIYMPGYTGLEVCDRVKNAPETAKMPVLLTVGKMEPYRAEDGAKVRADGVIIKPFEASDLIAAVAKLETLIAPKVSAPVTEEAFVEDEHWRTDASGIVTDQPATSFEVPEGMSSSPAMLAELSVEAPAENTNAMAAAALPAFAAVPGFESQDFSNFSVVPEQSSLDAIEASAPPAFGPFDTQMIESLGDSARPAYMDMYSAADEPEEFDIAAAVVSPAAVPAIEEIPFQSAAAEDMHAPESESAFDLEVEEPAPEIPVVAELAPDLEFNSAPKAGDVDVVPVAELEPETPAEQVETPAEVHDPFLITDPAEVVNPFVEHPCSQDSEENPSEALPVTESHAVVQGEDVEGSTVAEESLSDSTSTPVPSPIEVAHGVADWRAEETMVLPSEASALLEQEMQQSLEQPAPVETEPAMEIVADVHAPEGPLEEEEAASAPEPSEAALEEEPEPVAIAEEEQPALEVEPHDNPDHGADSHDALDQLRAEILAMEAMLKEPGASQPEETAAVVTETPTPVETHSSDLDAVEEQADQVLTNEVSMVPQESSEDILAPEEPTITAPEPQPEPLSESLPEPEVLSEAQPEPPLAQPEPRAETLALAESAVVSGATPGGGDSLIADVVQRVFERHKSQMIAEIARELEEGAK